MLRESSRAAASSVCAGYDSCVLSIDAWRNWRVRFYFDRAARTYLVLGWIMTTTALLQMLL